MEPWLDQAAKQGLNPEQLLLHRQRIASARKQQAAPQFKIVDSCTIRNGSVLPAKPPCSANKGFKIAAFIPAAGAASRYFAAFADLQLAIESVDAEKLAAALRGLSAQGAEEWPLPDFLLEQLKQSSHRDPQWPKWDGVLEQLKLPKALQPCVSDGKTFLDMKLLEVARQPELDHSYYVVNPIHKERFAGLLQADCSIREQGPKLSTVRFDQEMQPVRDGVRLSVVPAGHGALAELLPSIEGVDSVVIKNIDNVTGTSKEAIQATSQLIGWHHFLLEELQQLRNCADQTDWRSAEDRAEKILSQLGKGNAKDFRDVPHSALWQVIDRMFFVAEDSLLTEEALLKTLHRPLNTMGMVPNSGKDVGGTPCFVEVNGVRKRVCLEVPHASQQDKQTWLVDPDRATHFNPVFVCAEVPKSSEYYQKAAADFWLLAEKQYRGRAVYYHETALYELLSYSELANAVFVEIPRLLFNPHKSLPDAAGRRFKDWCPA